MAFKTFAQLTAATDVQDADLLAAYRGTGPLKSVTAAIHAAYLAVKLAATFLSTANNLSELTATASTARTNLGLGTAATQNVSTFAQAANNLSDLASAATARNNLGIAESLIVAVSDETSIIASGTAKLTFYIPYNFTLTEVFIGNTTASSSGLVTVNAKDNGSTVFTTQPSIGSGQNTSLSGTGSVPAVLAITALSKGDKITVDIAAAGTGATGLKVYFIGHKT
jgi:hypothetical protein